MKRIEFSPPDIRPEDVASVVRVLESGWITTGPVGLEFETSLQADSGAGGAALTNSATAALELALRLSGIGPGDEVIVPAYTYTATAAVVAHVGARIVMVDSQPSNPIPDIESIIKCVTPRTAGIITVDLGGVPYDIPALRSALEDVSIPSGRDGLCAKLGRPVIISDSAHSIGAKRQEGAVGSLADFTAFSFHAVKNITTAEGGALLWTDEMSSLDWDMDFSQYVRTLSLHGQTKDAFSKLRAGAWEYDIIVPGYKSNMPDVLAALGLSQYRRLAEILKKRNEIMNLYEENLEPLGFKFLNHHVDGGRSTDHLAISFLPKRLRERRNELIDQLAQHGIATNVHYKPLPYLTAYSKMGFDIRNYPNADALYRREITFPLHTRLKHSDIEFISELVAIIIGEMH